MPTHVKKIASIGCFDLVKIHAIVRASQGPLTRIKARDLLNEVASCLPPWAKATTSANFQRDGRRTPMLALAISCQHALEETLFASLTSQVDRTTLVRESAPPSCRNFQVPSRAESILPSTPLLWRDIFSQSIWEEVTKLRDLIGTPFWERDINAVVQLYLKRLEWARDCQLSISTPWPVFYRHLEAALATSFARPVFGIIPRLKSSTRAIEVQVGGGLKILAYRKAVLNAVDEIILRVEVRVLDLQRIGLLRSKSGSSRSEIQRLTDVEIILAFLDDLQEQIDQALDLAIEFANRPSRTLDELSSVRAALAAAAPVSHETIWGYLQENLEKSIPTHIFPGSRVPKKLRRLKAITRVGRGLWRLSPEWINQTKERPTE